MRKNPIRLLPFSSPGMCRCESAQKKKPLPTELEPKQIRSVMEKVADWQLQHLHENEKDHHPAGWIYAALYAGLTALAQMSETDAYYEILKDFGRKNHWQLQKRIYMADDHAVGQMYIDLYKKYKDPKMIEAVKKRFDYILANPVQSNLEMGSENCLDQYSWCDALFMAPPVWAKLARITGEAKYLDFMNRQWQAAMDYLYDREHHLFYRDSRFFTKREANGEKVFWSRGNGWVFGGLVRVLEEMPEEYPDRGNYEQLFREMAARIAPIQPESGVWHSSLLDPESYPSIETSGSGFYCYGLAWGVNQGYLDEATYLPAVIKAWSGLVRCVHPDGMLGYVQPVAGSPQHVQPDQTEMYGVGSFLLAGSEVYKITIRNDKPAKKMIAANPIQEFCDEETVSIDWNKIKDLVDGMTKNNAAVFEFKTNRFLDTQIQNSDKNTQLLFQTDFAPGEKKYFWLMKQPDGPETS